MKKKSFDSIDALKAFVGEPAVSGDAIVIDQAMIDQFAAVTHDQQWIHVDPERAALESPFKTTIAHGLLTLSLVTGWYHRCFDFPNRKMALNYGFDKVRFTSPVPCGTHLVGSFELAKVEDVKPGEVRCFWNVKVQGEGAERPAMVAEWLMQVRY
ncbi:MaoC family dehydratase [Variovorax sp. J22R24]|uniref:MaoC family dehydratase n=1 Tax=Variovorax gracilis TaxID=3053502 RepID=UPI0025771FC6|nr:MaoC family dehydratase [Variovorax sp. J22R24]MDM0108609.1 MaoC family dehydratase [Variovorax sp. J22R24]